MGKINWWKLASYLGMGLGGAATILGNITSKKEMQETITKEVQKALKDKK